MLEYCSDCHLAKISLRKGLPFPDLSKAQLQAAVNSNCLSSVHFVMLITNAKPCQNSACRTSVVWRLESSQMPLRGSGISAKYLYKNKFTGGPSSRAKSHLPGHSSAASQVGHRVGPALQSSASLGGPLPLHDLSFCNISSMVPIICSLYLRLKNYYAR